MLRFDRTLAVHHYAIATVLAVLLPAGLGLALSETVASGCYDSLCLLPLLLIITPIYGAPVLAALFAINRRIGKPVPDGWLPTVAISGIAGQAAISVFALATATPSFRDIYFSDLLSFPQGLVTGVAVGGSFWVTLHAVGRGPVST
jgi:hypothetical protein